MRYFIHLAFDGTDFHGWQIQQNAKSVQECLDKSLEILFRTSLSTTGCGRTDTGVHARDFYAHFDSENEIDCGPNKIHQLNSILPAGIVVYAIFPVKNEQHSRYDAVSRTYEYSLYNYKNPFLSRFALFYPGNPDISKMNEAAGLLIGKKDFSCFCKSGSDPVNTICEVTEAVWLESANGFVFRISANRFLRNMVRSIVGTLLEIGEGKSNLVDLQNILESRDRSRAGVSVPAKGLSLVKVRYDFFSKNK
ncbi:MAG: tRNA pseudouridine(38-40) synthase TruA [Bacteroidetes bacterium]|nr:MAG: tRNA pseudouridine(38-40) synthase TruA [Bacteroidota bacterium]REJ99862.1 MAG: tRNA pseudouridine(38-40) synthase TruA [Bacteroidota bacterium]REK34235.1 MAG: tRNA pseudouridine(38-40) synthase TruA [Bacteroidota bacterium]REK50565.1 MAG: tRNA pseudouridine(38-40) synthase TruA [Bacteroidota bacterium]